MKDGEVEKVNTRSQKPRRDWRYTSGEQTPSCSFNHCPYSSTVLAVKVPVASFVAKNILCFLFLNLKYIHCDITLLALDRLILNATSGIVNFVTLLTSVLNSLSLAVEKL